MTKTPPPLISADSAIDEDIQSFAGSSKFDYRSQLMARNAAQFERKILVRDAPVLIVGENWLKSTTSIILNYPASSTDILDMERKIVEEISGTLDEIIKRYSHDVFSSGFASQLSASVERLVYRYGDLGLLVLGLALDSRPSVSEDARVEILRTLGRIDDVSTSIRRFKLVVAALGSPSPLVRDEAALALLDLGEPRGKEKILAAAERERDARLRLELIATAEQLE